MKGPHKLTPGETLKALELSAEADEAMREVLAMSKEEVDRDLEAAGFNLEAQRAKAAARRDLLLARAGASARAPVAPAAVTPPAPIPPPAAPSPVVPVRRLPSRRPLRYLVLAAAMISVAAAAATARWGPWRSTEPGPRPPASAPPRSSVPLDKRGPDIAMIRRDAIDACKHQNWEPCLTGLDLARRYDPDGESDAFVTLCRQQATAALESPDAAGTHVNANAKQGSGAGNGPE